MKEEEAKNLPVTPWYRDLHKKHIMAKGEIGFISFVIKPMWESYHEFTGICEKQVENIKKNLEEWEKIKEEGLREEEEALKNQKS